MGVSVEDERRYNGCCPHFDDYNWICERTDRNVSKEEVDCYCQNDGNTRAYEDCYYYRRYKCPEPKQENNPEPDPMPSYEPEDDHTFDVDDDWDPWKRKKYKKSVTVGKSSILANFIALIVLIAVVMTGVHLVKENGLIKSNLLCEITMDESSGIKAEDVLLCLVPQKEGKEGYREQFDENGYCSLKVAPGNYDVYCAYDGAQIRYQTYELDAFSDIQLTLPIDDQLFRRGIIVRLTDQMEPVSPEKIEVVYDGEKSILYPSANGEYYLSALKNKPEIVCTINVDGYQPVEVRMNPGDCTLGILDIALTEGE